MIVADVNLIAYLLIDVPSTAAARDVLKRDSHWIAPPLWRYELRNVVATSIRVGGLPEDRGMLVLANAPSFVQDAEMEAPPIEIVRLAVATKRATYDCEYVLLARILNIKFVTADGKVLSQFPDVAISIGDFATGH